MIYIEYNTDKNNKLDDLIEWDLRDLRDLMIMGREKKRSKIYKSFVLFK